MRAKKITITVDEWMYRNLDKAASERGFRRIPALVRYLAANGISGGTEAGTDRRCLAVQVDNFRELLGYVEAKKLGSVEVFATYAMAQYMARYPLSGGQKRREGE
ncbi:MAG: hypothetical protein LBK13_06730 [Spirochaetales bacterium]|jgi:hypothetical protein|nr:hypothetical protein [Spirochaetales bacterium]